MTTARQTLLQTVESTGWHFNNEFIDDLLHEKPNLNSNELVKIALNIDMKSMGRKCIPETVMIGKCEGFDGPCVVQVVKMKNLAAPKENEHSTSAPPFYKVTLTDGVQNCNALVMDEIQSLNLETAPGTKLLLKGNIKVKTSSLLLTSQNCQVLGGIVENLFSKWKAAKDLVNHVRTGASGDGGAPPYVPFGQTQTVKVDTSKKALQQTEVQEDTSSEFSQQRQAALAEAMQDKLKITKTFIHQNVDKNVVAPPTNVQEPVRQSSAPVNNPPKKGGRFRNRNNDDDDGDYKEVSSAKPTATTLFDFINKKDPKLQIKDDTSDAAKQSNSSTSNTDNNNNPTNVKPYQQQISATSSTGTSSAGATSNNATSSSNNNNSTSNQQYNNNTNNRRPNNRDQNSYNSDYNTKERSKANLPPRLQRANDERYNNNNNNNTSGSNFTNNPRRSNGNMTSAATNADRPQKYNKYQNDVPSSAPQPQTPPTVAAAAAATTTNASTTKQTTNNDTKIDNSYDNNDNYYSTYQTTYYTNKKFSKNKYNNNSNNNRGNQNDYYYQKSYYNNNNNNYHNNQANNAGGNTNTNTNSSNNSNNNKMQATTYYVSQGTPTNAPQTAPANAPPSIPTQYVPINVYYDPASAPHHPGVHHPAAAGYPGYYNGQIAAATVYAQNPYQFDAPNGATYYCPPTVLPLPIPISSAAIATTIPPQLITSVAPIPTHVVPPQPQQQQPVVEQQQTQYQPQQQPVQQQQQLSDNNNNPTDNSINKNNSQMWKKGDSCLAIYAADKKHYPAIIKSINKNNKVYVEYIGYNDFSEVHISDIKPYSDNNNNSNNSRGANSGSANGPAVATTTTSAQSVRVTHK